MWNLSLWWIGEPKMKFEDLTPEGTSGKVGKVFARLSVRLNNSFPRRFQIAEQGRHGSDFVCDADSSRLEKFRRDRFVC